MGSTTTTTTTTTVNHQLLEQLKDVGDKLLKPPSSTPELLNLLDEAVLLLSKVGQAPSQLVHEALLSMMKALISDNLMKNSDADIMITVAACLNELLRISAPVAPYDDEKMKDIFELIVLSFDKLSCPPGRCYSKAVLILESVARLRSCVMMLDLDCDSLVTKMFEFFQKHISSNHPQFVISAMEKIMCVMIIESDSLPVELLKVLLDSIRKENENNSPAVFELGTKVVKECSEKLQPYIMETVTSIGCCLDDYAPILSSICETEPIAVEEVHDSAKHMPLKTIEPCSQNPKTDSGTASKKGENMVKKSPESPRVHLEKSSVAPRTKKAVPVTEDEPHKRTKKEARVLDKKNAHQASVVGGNSDKKGKPPKKNVSGGSRKKSTTGLTRKDRIETNDAVRSQRKRASSEDDVFETPHGRKNYKEDLVGCRIKVWWPLDHCHYEGSISSYDASTKKHKVDYDDGDQEVLNLRTEQWEFVGDEISTDIALLLDKKSSNQQRVNKPKREASTVFEKETSLAKSNKREVMHDIGNEGSDGSHQAAKIVEKVKSAENLSETKRP